MALRRAGLRSLAALGRRAKVSLSYLTHIRMDTQRAPSAHTIRRLAVALWISDDEVLPLLRDTASDLPSSDPPAPEENEMRALSKQAHDLVDRIARDFHPDTAEWIAMMVVLRKLAGADPRQVAGQIDTPEPQ
jgi:transcriptional regulator with XRE-family HTH domain